jgi:predicted porin
MKHLFAAALAASLAFCAAITTGFAADKLGGDCCADIEERVASLEAATARKGTRKTSVTVSGQVSKSILWVDADLKDGVIGDNANSPSRLAISGSARLSPRVTAGYTIEIGVADTLSIRHSYLWVDGPVGKTSLGLTSTATDGIGEISVANTNVASLPTSIYGAATDGSRANVLRYDSPTIAGFVASAAFTADGVWDAALRYAGEGNGFRLAAGIGYAELLDDKRVSGSASLMHIASGLFVNGVLGRLDVGTSRIEAWHVAAGIERKVVAFGSTTLFGEYGVLNTFGTESKGWGLGAVQAFDAAGMDVFATYRDTEGVNVLHVGTRIKF